MNQATSASERRMIASESIFFWPQQNKEISSYIEFAKTTVTYYHRIWVMV